MLGGRTCGRGDHSGDFRIARDKAYALTSSWTRGRRSRILGKPLRQALPDRGLSLRSRVFSHRVNPSGMQYAAEAVRPTPEGSSNGLVSLGGQASVASCLWMETINTATVLRGVAGCVAALLAFFRLPGDEAIEAKTGLA